MTTQPNDLSLSEQAARGLDPRVNAFRPDLADTALQSAVKAARYVNPSLRHCVRGLVSLVDAPNTGARKVSDIRYGEFLDVLEERKDGYFWVQNRFDRVVGYLRGKAILSEEIADLSYRLTALRTFVYQEPDERSAVLDCLTLGSYVSPRGGRGERFQALAGGGFVYAGHMAPSGEALCPDYVFTAGRFLGAPYLAGGRSPLGIDGGALVQIALDMAGYEVPRFADLQRSFLGQNLPMHWRDVIWRRGDLVFLQRHSDGAAHVGLMVDHLCLIHASVAAMQVVVDRLDDVVASGFDVVAAGRPF